jgi:hypothetical protein
LDDDDDDDDDCDDDCEGIFDGTSYLRATDLEGILDESSDGS